MIALQKEPALLQTTKLSDDQALWREYKKGNADALTKLYERHAGALYKYGLHTCKDPELVLDCLQDIFSRLWSRRQHMAYVSCVRVYLFKSFQRLLIHQLISKRKLKSSPGASSAELMPSFEEILIDHEWTTERAMKLKDCIRSLTKTQREAILLRFFNNLSYTEISEVMEMQVGSVYNLISKAIEKLRKKAAGSLFPAIHKRYAC